MAEPLYVVTGAAGNVGSVVASALLDAKKRVRVVGRDVAKLKKFAGRGAEVMVASAEDAASLTKAFQGATAAFVMVPPSYTAPDFRAFQKKVVDATATALEAARVRHVVTLSSVGADLPSGNGPIAGLHDLEQRLNRIKGLNVLHLRPGYFMENHLMSVPQIRQMGMNGGPIRGNVPIPMIAAKDVGATAAKRLAALDFQASSVLELLGPRDVTMEQATTALGTALEKPGLRYVNFPYEDAKKAMAGSGLSEDLAGLYVEMARGFNEGTVRATQPRTAATSTPTTIESFTASLGRPPA